MKIIKVEKNRICFEVSGCKVWYSKKMIDEQISKHEKELARLHKLRGHINNVNEPECSIRGHLDSYYSNEGKLTCPKCGEL